MLFCCLVLVFFNDSGERLSTVLRGPGELLLETLRDQTEWFSAQTLECKADRIMKVLDAAPAWVLLRLAQ